MISVLWQQREKDKIEKTATVCAFVSQQAGTVIHDHRVPGDVSPPRQSHSCQARTICKKLSQQCHLVQVRFPVAHYETAAKTLYSSTSLFWSDIVPEGCIDLTKKYCGVCRVNDVTTKRTETQPHSWREASCHLVPSNQENQKLHQEESIKSVYQCKQERLLKWHPLPPRFALSSWVWTWRGL